MPAPTPAARPNRTIGRARLLDLVHQWLDAALNNSDPKRADAFHQCAQDLLSVLDDCSAPEGSN